MLLKFGYLFLKHFVYIFNTIYINIDKTFYDVCFLIYVHTKCTLKFCIKRNNFFL